MKGHVFHYTDFWCQILQLARRKKADWKRGEKICFLARKTLWGRCSKSTVFNNTHTQAGTLNVHEELHSLFHFQITLSYDFLDAILKTKAIISIQFVPSLCMNTDRLSYSGHAPRGELWEAGGQINGYYYSHCLITEHLDLGAEGVDAATMPPLCPPVPPRELCTMEPVIDSRR